MIQFIEERLPEDISYGSQGGPTFKTDIFEADSGAESRNISWTEARAEYDIQFGIRDMADMETVTKFFYNVRGRAIGFRYKDWADFMVEGQVIGEGDGVTTTFQLVKTYVVGTNVYTRDILKPVDGTVVVYIAGTPDAGATLDTTTGLVTFSTVPPLGAELTADFEFDVPVRFDIDHLPLTHDAWQQMSSSGIKLKEIKDF